MYRYQRRHAPWQNFRRKAFVVVAVILLLVAVATGWYIESHSGTTIIHNPVAKTTYVTTAIRRSRRLAKRILLSNCRPTGSLSARPPVPIIFIPGRILPSMKTTGFLTYMSILSPARQSAACSRYQPTVTGCK